MRKIRTKQRERERERERERKRERGSRQSVFGLERERESGSDLLGSRNITWVCVKDEVGESAEVIVFLTDGLYYYLYHGAL